MSAIERAIQICNGRQKLADAAGVSVQAVHFWASGGRKISAEFVPKIVAATGGHFAGIASIERLRRIGDSAALLDATSGPEPGQTLIAPVPASARPMWPGFFSPDQEVFKP